MSIVQDQMAAMKKCHSIEGFGIYQLFNKQVEPKSKITCEKQRESLAIKGIEKDLKN